MDRFVGGLIIVLACSGVPAPLIGHEISVKFFHLRSAGDVHDVEQASDLHFGRVGDRHGLWIVCDRNGRQSAGKIYYISNLTLQAARHRETLVADCEFTIIPPSGEWSAFAQAHRGAGEEVLAELRKRITPGEDRTDEPYLDLEAITVAPGTGAASGDHLFVVAEEPFSTVLELALEGNGPRAAARVAAVYAYQEAPEDQGSVRNDGIEGLAYAGRPGRFYFAEEATRKLDDQPRSLQLFSLAPRLGEAELKDGRVQVATRPSEQLTDAVRACRQGRMQTLNALTLPREGRLLAVDRNGGWILAVDPAARAVRPWLNLYDLGGINLRKELAEFPMPRQMPYISIEGIAVDDAGALWLADDPAMPEGWRASCLVRLGGLPGR